MFVAVTNYLGIWHPLLGFYTSISLDSDPNLQRLWRFWWIPVSARCGPDPPQEKFSGWFYAFGKHSFETPFPTRVSILNPVFICLILTVPQGIPPQYPLYSLDSVGVRCRLVPFSTLLSNTGLHRSNWLGCGNFDAKMQTCFIFCFLFKMIDDR